jgi:hypothetical protein
MQPMDLVPGTANVLPMLRVTVLSLFVVILLAATGCGPGTEPRTAEPPTAGTADCGKVDAAGGASAYLRITRGSATCPEAVSVYTAFFAEIAAGKAPGQGSGGRLAVRGWSCVIHPPDTIQRDGRGADCTKGDTTVTAFQNPR